MNDRFNIRYFNKNTKKFEYLKIGAVNFNLFTDWTVYEQGQFCTGLKDKNGKLIYEGDIVEFYSQSLLDAMSRKGLARRVGQVVWNDEFLKFDVTVKSKAVPNLCKETDDNNFEVIGNIYENKELLESEG